MANLKEINPPIIQKIDIAKALNILSALVTNGVINPADIHATAKFVKNSTKIFSLGLLIPFLM